MRVEVLCTGEELLTGLTTDTNSPYFMGKLMAMGERVRKTTVVGDVREEIATALREASGRADILLVSGGLGPTADDITAECVADALGVPLVEDAEVLKSLKERFARRGIEFTPNNARQAQVPKGAEVVHNSVGSAPMLVLRMGKCIAMFVPGVPREYKHLVDTQVLPRIHRILEAQEGRIFRASKLLKTVMRAESHLDAQIATLVGKHPKVTFGFRTHYPENHVTLVAEGQSQAQADSFLAAAEASSRELLGKHFFGVGEDSFAGIIGRLLEQRHETVAVAESCTGGKLADAFVRNPGASVYFLGSAVCYADEMKERWLDVAHGTLAEHGAVSEATAKAMAEGARERAGSTWALSVTGVAGPSGGSEEKPVGTVFYALSGPRGTKVNRHRFMGDREMIRQGAAYAALDMLRLALLEPSST